MAKIGKKTKSVKKKVAASVVKKSAKTKAIKPTKKTGGTQKVSAAAGKRLNAQKPSARKTRASRSIAGNPAGGVEWVDGKIVLSAPPANPLKGKGNQRLTKEEVGWAITESLFDWFYKHLEYRHKTSGRIIHNDGDALRDMLDEDPNFNNNYYAISPEANKLLNDKLEFWKEKVREGSKLKREQKKQEMEGGDFETPPEWVGENIVLPKPAESPNKKYFWKPNFDGENYKAVLWFRDHLPNTHQGQITDPNNGYPAKTMSTEAGELWFKHKGFWLAQYFIPIKEKEAQKKEL